MFKKFGTGFPAITKNYDFLRQEGLKIAAFGYFCPNAKLNLLGELLLKAIITGFVLSIMIGPVFFILLETSIKKGVRAGLSFDAGVLVSDLIYISIAYIFFSEVSAFTKGDNEGLLKMFGGCMFLIYGVISYLKKPKEQMQDELGNSVFNSRDYILLFVKGLVLNMANPLVIFYWFSVLALGAKDSSYFNGTGYMFFYICVILITFFSIDILKIFGAKRLRPFITNALLQSLNRITGGILFIFGIILLLQGILSKV